uniref:T-cell receptor T3 zeta chain n=1 Tax=Amphilophus citrinellus TaxID=61819 RepID=A0A3Q0RTZ5_AMPCI
VSRYFWAGSETALNMYDPQLCYILDGFLGVYGLIITGMFIKEKVGGAALFLSFTDLKGQDAGTYEPLRDPERGGRVSLLFPCSSSPAVMITGLSSATRDTYDSLQMQNLPPR